MKDVLSKLSYPEEGVLEALILWDGLSEPIPDIVFLVIRRHFRLDVGRDLWILFVCVVFNRALLEWYTLYIALDIFQAYKSIEA